MMADTTSLLPREIRIVFRILLCVEQTTARFRPFLRFAARVGAIERRKRDRESFFDIGRKTVKRLRTPFRQFVQLLEIR